MLHVVGMVKQGISHIGVTCNSRRVHTTLPWCRFAHS